MQGFKDVLDTFMQQLRRANPNVPQSVLDEVAKGVRGRVESEPAPRLALVGDTGVGKSATINALFNAGREVGHTRATTASEFGVTVKFGPLDTQRGELIVYDMPGLNESMATRRQHLETYARVLANVDVALWVLEAHHRPMESVQRFLRNDMRRMNPSLVNRVVFALNKVDLVHPGPTAWHPLAKLPSPEQQLNIEARIKDVERLVLEALPRWRGTIIGYSATERYNLPQLFAVMLDAVAKKRQWVFADRMALADFFEMRDDRFLPADRQRGTVVGDGRRAVPSAAIRDALVGMSDEEFLKLVGERDRLNRRP